MRPSASHAAGHDREVAAMRLVVVALRAVDDEAEHGPAASSRLHRRAATASTPRTGAGCRLAAPRASARASRAPATPSHRAQRRALRRAEVVRPDRAKLEGVRRRACRARSAAGLRRTRPNAASKYERLSGSFGDEPQREAFDGAAVVGHARAAQDVRGADPHERRIVDGVARRAMRPTRARRRTPPRLCRTTRAARRRPGPRSSRR